MLEQCERSLCSAIYYNISHSFVTVSRSLSSISICCNDFAVAESDGAWITTFHGGSDTCFSYITRSGCLVMLNRGELVVLSSNNKHSSSTNNGILCLPARSFADQFADLLWTATLFIATPTRSSFVRWIRRHAQFWINFCNNDVDSSKLKLNYNKEQGFQLPTTTIHGHITWSIE